MGDSENKFAGELISRLTMAVLAIALVFGGIKVMRGAHVVSTAFRQADPNPQPYYDSHVQQDKGVSLMYWLGFGLIGAGAALGWGRFCRCRCSSGCFRRRRTERVFVQCSVNQSKRFSLTTGSFFQYPYKIRIRNGRRGWNCPIRKPCGG